MAEKQTPVTNPSSYVAPKTNGTAVRANADSNEEEEDVENAGKCTGKGRVYVASTFDDMSLLDDWDILDGMTEEEATLLALEMSRTVEADAGD